MRTPNTSLESEIVDWLVHLIENDELREAISNTESLLRIAKSARQSSYIRSYSVDQMSRLASAEAAQVVLESLGLLEIIAINKSISLATGEILRPDILCFNPESRTLVVFEVKRETFTERQTITELAGYEHELRNALPFLGNFEICFVVVAKDWSTLLDHAVANLNAWSGKKCLALKVDVESQPFGLTCHLPEAWHLTGSFGLPPDALQTISLYLVEEEPDLNEHSPPRSLLTAMEVMARAGDRAGSHGFMMLWKDVNGMGQGRWAFTLCAVDPISMHSWCSMHGLPRRESEVTRYFDKQVADAPALVPSVVYRIATEAFPILEDRYDPQFEGAFSWHESLRQRRAGAVPIRFEFWGTLGEYAREFVCNTDVRNRHMPFIGRNELDWTDPEVAVPLIESLSGYSPFAGGMIRCSDAFHVGVTLGILELVAGNAARSDKAATHLEPLLRWSHIEALRYAVEMHEIYLIANEVTIPIPAISDRPERRLQAVKELSSWVQEHLLGREHRVHQTCFSLGRYGAALFSKWFEGGERLIAEENRQWLTSEVKRLVGTILLAAEERVPYGNVEALDQLREILVQNNFSPNGNGDAELRKSLDGLPGDVLLDATASVVLPALDSVIPVVAHTVAPMPELEVDWDGLKAGVRAAFDAGHRWPAVIVSQDGTVGSGFLVEPMTQFAAPIADPAKEVYFFNEQASASIAVKFTWTALMQRGLSGKTSASCKADCID
ncbi:hypothetical protein P3W85_37290 [Cupriavidus basilensis]|uniref:Uncharacterized protein n=1 Tax=Cupriavidus basilensis TaxID=68895 RepID=A0ABT6B0Y6_9BURK|nr:hypothetical protein [Cupriavidus basilensis]MDF3838549.1 hypothetical protein [Cupriavidus basilensis]